MRGLWFRCWDLRQSQQEYVPLHHIMSYKTSDSASVVSMAYTKLSRGCQLSKKAFPFVLESCVALLDTGDRRCIKGAIKVLDLMFPVVAPPVAVKAAAECSQRTRTCSTRYTNIRPASFKSANLMFGTGGCTRLQFQSATLGAKSTKLSQKLERIRRREEREEAQRKKAEEKARARYKSLPKQVRELNVREGRALKEEKNAIEMQGPLRVAAVAAGCIAGALGLKLGSDKLRQQIEGIFKHVVATLKDFCGPIWKTALVVFCFWVMRRVCSGNAIAATVVSSILGSYFFKEELLHIMPFFRASGETSEVEHQSALEPDSGFAADASKLICGFMALSVFRNQGKKDQTGEFMKRISTFTRASEGFGSFMTWAFTSMQNIVKHFVKFSTGGRFELFKTKLNAVQKWLHDANDCVAKHRTLAQGEGAEVVDEIVELLKDGFVYRDIYRGHKLHSLICLTLSELNTTLQPYMGTLASRNNSRFEPRMVILAGAPGIGKTLLAKYFVMSVMGLSGLMPPGSTEADYNAEMWQKGQSKYFNGYSGQKAYIMDDALQGRAETQMDENDYFMLIKAVSNWSLPLNMADLNSKGRVYFTSKLIYATTNLMNIKSDADKVINDVGAVVRRFAFPYVLYPHPDYVRPGTNFLDYKKVDMEFRANIKAGLPSERAFPFHAWEVSKHNFLTGQTEVTRKPLGVLVAEVARDMKEHLDLYEESKEAAKQFAENLGTLEDFEAAVRHESNDIHSYQGMFPCPSPASLDSCDEEELERYKRMPRFAAVKDAVRELLTWHKEQSRLASVLKGLAFLGAGVGAIMAAIAIIKALLKGVRALFPKKDRYVSGPTWRGRPLQEWNNDVVALMRSRRPNYDSAMITVNKHHMVQKVIYFEGESMHVEDFSPFRCYYFLDSVIQANCPELQSNLPSPKLSVLRTTKKTDIQFEGFKPSFAPNAHVPSDDARTARDTIRDAVYAIVHVGVENTFVGNFMMINSTLAMLPRHYLEQLTRDLANGIIRTDDTLQFANAKNNKVAYTTSVGSFLDEKAFPKARVADSDIAFVDVARLAMRAHRNIQGSFITEKCVSLYAGHPVTLDIFRYEGCSQQMESMCSTTVHLAHNVNAPQLMRRAWRYSSLNTKRGDCGSPLTITNIANKSGLICMGFHSAGEPARNFGYASVVTQEIISAAMKQLNIIDDRFLEELPSMGFDISFESAPFLDMGSFMPICQINRRYPLPNITKWYPIESTFGMFGDYPYKPAHLKPFFNGKEWINPMQQALEPYAGSILNFERPYFKQAMHLAFKPLTELGLGDTREVLDMETAVKGNHVMKLKAINRGSSPGFPHALDVKNGKVKFLGTDGEYDLSTPAFQEVRAKVNSIIADAREGKRRCHIFIDFLKDELRSNEKVDAGKTRLISCAPMEYTIATRMLFGAFISSFFRHHTKSGMAPGICAYTEWHLLKEMLTARGDKVFDGDFKGFDTSEQAEILEMICDHINLWYNDSAENQRARKVLFMELTHSRHLGGNGFDQSYVYQWNRSLPSGHPLTTVVNSLYSLFALIACYIKMTGDITGFWSRVSAVTYGDDNVVNPSDAVADMYNQVTIAETMQSELGLIYTSGHKDGKLVPYTTLDKITFLQRGVRDEAREVWSPLNPDSFLYTAYWGQNRQLEPLVVANALEKALEEMSQHEPSMWEKYAGQIVEHLRAMGRVTNAEPSRESYQALLRSRSDSWY